MNNYDWFPMEQNMANIHIFLKQLRRNDLHVNSRKWAVIVAFYQSILV